MMRCLSSTITGCSGKGSAACERTWDSVLIDPALVVECRVELRFAPKSLSIINIQERPHESRLRGRWTCKLGLPHRSKRCVACKRHHGKCYSLPGPLQRLGEIVLSTSSSMCAVASHPPHGHRACWELCTPSGYSTLNPERRGPLRPLSSIA